MCHKLVISQALAIRNFKFISASRMRMKRRILSFLDVFSVISGQAKFKGRWRKLQEITAGIEVWWSTQH